MTRERAIELLEFNRTKLKFDPGTGEPDTFRDCEDAELYDALLMAIKDMELIREALIVGFNGEEVVFHDSGMAYAIYGKPRKQMERKCPRNKDNPMKVKVENWIIQYALLVVDRNCQHIMETGITRSTNIHTDVLIAVNYLIGEI